MASLADAARDASTTLFLDAPDKYIAGAMLSINKICNGSGDRASIYNAILDMTSGEVATIPDFAGKLHFVATSEVYGKSIYKD